MEMAVVELVGQIGGLERSNSSHGDWWIEGATQCQVAES